jgi:K(+)-stimulated pyrophosphate-energized sodium pump
MVELALILGSGVLGIAFAAYLARWVLAQPAGDGETARLGALVKRTAERFFARQSSIIAALAAVLGGAIFLAYGLRRGDAGDPVSALDLGVWLTVSFALGVACSLAVGRVALWAATRTNLRAATGIRRSLDLGLQIGIRGGAVSGLFLTATALLGQGGLFAAVFAAKGGFGRDPGAALALAPSIPLMIAGYALGASFAALLAELGGGSFAKAADLGADLAGRAAGLGEDHLDNPAVIVDLAGDAAGDCAGRSAGLFESIVAENLAAMLVGAMLYRQNPAIPSALAVMLFPLVTRAFGLVAAAFGVMVVRTDDREAPQNALARGLYVTALLHVVGTAGAAKWLLGDRWLHFFGCGAIGIGAFVAFFHVTQYYTDHRHRPVRELADASRAGPTFTLLYGMATGIESSIVPFALLVLAVLGASELGARTGLASGGLYGAAATMVGMLGAAGYVLAMDAFGPVIDNARGLVEMTIARERPDVRGRAVMLDAVGNTVKALTKAYAASAAALASLLLVAAYLDEVRRRVAVLGKKVDPSAIHVGRPEVFLGALVGILLVFWIAGRCILGVVRPARRLLDEVRRQLNDRPSGLPPDYDACVEMVSRAALRHMIAPALVAVGAPIVVGLALRFARTEDNPLVAADSVAALIMAGTVAGVLGSLLLGNAGGAWDNAKKYIATGAHGGRHLVDEAGARVDNPTYTSALVGDTVGDPLKDTAGPAMHVLVKMLPVVTIVFLPFFL